ncbi:MAG TPA: dihydrodipicolinate reductase [Acidimicrobiia bacterium]|nr:dihydrodipicolinate reductase [Acidimicrobiia bacterium]
MPYRVVQWATGNIGRRSLRASLAHPDLEVVGVRVFGADKVGVDAGELAGTGAHTGVTATDDVDALVALDADCVLHMPSRLDVDELCRLLASGKNVVSTCAELVHVRRALPAEVADRLESACKEGDVSLFATGSSPGFISDVFPIALLFLERSLDTLLIEEFADLSQRDSPKLLFEVMGMGRRPGAVDARRAEHMRASFGPPLEALAERIGVAIDRVEATTEVAVASRRVTIAAGDIEAGCIAAQRTTVDALAGDDARLSFRATWYCTDALDADWPLGATGWRVTVEGDAPLKVDVAFPVEPDQLGAMTPGLTAHPAVNSVVAVCAARPGVLTSADLGVIVPRLA